MYRSFIATALAAALALTSFSAPARADSDDIAKALIGLALIAGVAAAIDNRNDRRRDAAAPVTRDHRRPIARDYRRLPSACLRPFETHRGTRYGFGIGCLNNRAAHIDAPERCERSGTNRRGRWTTFYAERCMARQGFTVARR